MKIYFLILILGTIAAFAQMSSLPNRAVEKELNS